MQEPIHALCLGKPRHLYLCSCCPSTPSPFNLQYLRSKSPVPKSPIPESSIPHACCVPRPILSPFGTQVALSPYNQPCAAQMTRSFDPDTLRNGNPSYRQWFSEPMAAQTAASRTGMCLVIRQSSKLVYPTGLLHFIGKFTHTVATAIRICRPASLAQAGLPVRRRRLQTAGLSIDQLFRHRAGTDVVWLLCACLSRRADLLRLVCLG